MAVLCAVHCAATPLLVAVAPVLTSRRFEAALSALLGTFSALLVLRGARRHRRWHVLLPLLLGLGALVAGRAQDRCCGAEALGPERAALLVPSCVGFVSARVLNARALGGCCTTCA